MALLSLWNLLGSRRCRNVLFAQPVQKLGPSLDHFCSLHSLNVKAFDQAEKSGWGWRDLLRLSSKGPTNSIHGQRHDTPGYTLDYFLTHRCKNIHIWV